MPPSRATIVVSGCAVFQSPHVLVYTVVISSVNPASLSGPVSASPVKVSKTEKVLKSNITLLERDSSPEVRSSMGSNPAGTTSVKYAWAEPHRVQ